MDIKSKYSPSGRSEMIEFVINSPQITLEIGCREGLFSKNIRDKFDTKEAWGVEPDLSVKYEAEKNLDKIVFSLFDENINLPEKYFDLIIFNDVLEHMYDPWKALEKAKKLLTENGIIIASIPNIRHKSVLKQLIFSDNFKYEDSGILDITHIRFFTKKTMIKLFEETGFEIIKMKPVVLLKKRRWYKKIIQFPRKCFNFITFNKFESIQYAQYAFTIKIKN